MSLIAALLIAVLIYLLTHSLLWAVVVPLLVLVLAGGLTYWPRR